MSRTRATKPVQATLPGRTTADLRRWAHARRYAVPRWMIERATAAREAGDWRGACAVSDVDVTFDVADIARRHGEAVAGQLADDLAGLAPDLLRWHLPREDTDMHLTDVRCILARYGAAGDDQLRLTATPWAGGKYAQRLKLQCVPLSQRTRQIAKRLWWTGLRHLWDARRADELRSRSGGGDRVPFFDAEGTPRPFDPAAAGAVIGADPATRTEHVTALHHARDLPGMFAAAGMSLTGTPSAEWWNKNGLASFPLALTQWAPALAALRPVGDVWYVKHWYGTVFLAIDASGAVTAETVSLEDARELWRRRTGKEQYWNALPSFPEAAWQRPVDLDLVAAGHVIPEELHPLVRAALFPKRSTVDGPAGPPDPPAAPPRVQVRCGGRLHSLSPKAGRLGLLDHTDADIAREEAMVAFGGERAGCNAVRHVWSTGEGSLQRDLKTYRDDLLSRLRHGDLPGVTAMLDAGLDPAVRDGDGRSLLHHLYCVDHRELLPRLLAAGLDVNARSRHDESPLQVAATHRAPQALLQDLIAAGATETASGWRYLADNLRQARQLYDRDFVAEIRARAT